MGANRGLGAHGQSLRPQLARKQPPGGGSRNRFLLFPPDPPTSLRLQSQSHPAPRGPGGPGPATLPHPSIPARCPRGFPAPQPGFPCPGPAPGRALQPSEQNKAWVSWTAHLRLRAAAADAGRSPGLALALGEWKEPVKGWRHRDPKDRAGGHAPHGSHSLHSTIHSFALLGASTASAVAAALRNECRVGPAPGPPTRPAARAAPPPAEWPLPVPGTPRSLSPAVTLVSSGSVTPPTVEGNSPPNLALCPPSSRSGPAPPPTVPAPSPPTPLFTGPAPH